MRHIAIMFDENKNYVEKLAGYFNVSDIFPFEVRAFYKWEQVEHFCKKNEVEILITDERSKDQIFVLNVKEVIYLTSKSLSTYSDNHNIYKYQEAEIIIKQVMSYLSESSEIGILTSRKKPMKLISFFSPVKRAMSTTMSIGMGQLLGKRYKTLYINLESYSGLDKLLGRNFSKDITDLLYYIESKNGNINMAISGIVEQVEGVDVLPPAKNQGDIIVVSFNQWRELIDSIERDTDYEFVILDLSDAVQGLINILDISDYVVTCVDNDEVAISKIIQYENSLYEMGYDQILEKTKKCNVPHQHRKNGEIRYLGSGELGEYISNVLQGMINNE